MRRPRSFTLLAVLLAWLGLGGLALAFWAHSIDVRPGVALAFQAGGLAYGLSALVSAIALWRVRPWAGTALRAWGVAAGAGALLPLLVVKAPASPILQALGSVLVVRLCFAVARWADGRYASIVASAA